MLVLLTSVPAFASPVNDLGWGDLVPIFEFDDPFAQITENQLYNLSTIVRVKQLQQMGKDIGEVSGSGFKRAMSSLTQDGTAYKVLLARRSEIRALRRMRVEAVVDDLERKFVSLGGYLRPL